MDFNGRRAKDAPPKPSNAWLWLGRENPGTPIVLPDLSALSKERVRASLKRRKIRVGG